MCRPHMLVGLTRGHWAPYVGEDNTRPVGPKCWWGKHGATEPHMLVGPTRATGPQMLVEQTRGHWAQHAGGATRGHWASYVSDANTVPLGPICCRDLHGATWPHMLLRPTRDQWRPYAVEANTGPLGPICWWGQHGASGPHMLVQRTQSCSVQHLGFPHLSSVRWRRCDLQRQYWASQLDCHDDSEGCH